MHFTGGNTLLNSVTRINWQVVTLAASLGLAVGAAAGLGALDWDTAPSAPSQPAPSVIRPAATSPHATMPRPIMYVVESAEQEALVTAAMDADRIVAVMEGQEVPFQQTGFLVVSTLEDEQALNEILREQLMLTEPAFENR